MENLIKKYEVNGGKLFTIKSIDNIRDGGTKVIKTSKNNFYFSVDKQFHTGYPTLDENLITDYLLINYIIERIEIYVKNLEEDIIQQRNQLKIFKEIIGK